MTLGGLAAGGSWLAGWAALLLLLAFLLFARGAAQLWVIDLREHRLPNRILFPLYPQVGLPLLASLWLSAGPLGLDAWQATSQMLAGGLVMAFFYLLLRLGSAGSLGLGDVKLAGLLGLLLAYLSPLHLLLGNLLIFLTGGLYSLGLLLAGRARLKSHIAFGPFMLLGTVLALIYPV